MNNEIDKLKYRIAELEQQLLDEMDCVNRWPVPVRVSDHLPPLNENVLGFAPCEDAWLIVRRYFHSHYSREVFDVGEGICCDPDKITHWMPLPPKVQE